MKGISVIIVSYNTSAITSKCISLMEQVLISSSLTYEIIVIDNHSIDDSQHILKMFAKEKKIKLIINRKNTGFGAANNQGLAQALFDTILFLNSDVFIDKDLNLNNLLTYMEQPKIGAMTVQVLLPNGQIDPASHRGFPTLWASFCYFIGLERIFGNVPFFNTFFGNYHLTFLDKKSIHKIDSPTGAFYLTKKSILRKVGGFDEDFFMYGEDLDLSYRIKKLGYDIIYYPVYKVTHHKYQSGIGNKYDEEIRRKIKKYFYEAMIIFYKKHYQQYHCSCINRIVYFLIHLREHYL